MGMYIVGSVYLESIKDQDKSKAILNSIIEEIGV